MRILRYFSIKKSLSSQNYEKYKGIFDGRTSISRWEVNFINECMKKIREIPWSYKEDCCHARAHMMCGLVASMGLPVQKGWAFSSVHFDGQEGGFLRAPMKNALGGFFNWSYHVAPVISVTSGGSANWWVIDPSVSPDRALGLSDWVAAMGDPRARTLLTPPEVFAMHPTMGTWDEEALTEQTETQRSLEMHRQRAYFV